MLACFQILDYHFLPVTHKMADNVRACLLETEEVKKKISVYTGAYG